MTRRAGLSKSKLLSFRQCPKRLWLERYKPAEAAVDEAVQLVFAQGHEVGRVARSMFPAGVLVGHDAELAQALQQTEALVTGRERVPVFEATFQRAGTLVRVDVLEPEGHAGWYLREVKSTSEVKDYHVEDVAIQRWVLEGAGVRLKRQSLMHVETTWTYRGDGDYRGLLTEADLTGATEALSAEVGTWVKDAQAVLSGDEPDIAMGEQCSSPYGCPFQTYCAAQEGVVEFPVMLLPGNAGKSLARTLIEEGYADLRDVPAKRIDHAQFSLIHRVTSSGRPHLDPAARRVFDALDWPRAYFDFESISLAVPRWPRTRPYQHVTFQWSSHLETAPGQLEHVDFLDISGDDPRRGCAEEMLRVLRGVPVVFVYNASFERARIRELAERFPDLSDELLRIAEALVDLLPLVKQHYYHRDMRGSYSLKAVLPAMVGFDPYVELDGVQGGASAQMVCYEALQPGTTAARREQIAEQLRAYCGLDTWSSVAVAYVLQGKHPPPLPQARS